MKKCPFCAEEIQDKAVKCKHCGEWLSDVNKLDKPYINQNVTVSKRILCEDGSCIGVIKKDGICSECRRSIDEVRNNVESKNQEQLTYVPIDQIGQTKEKNWLSCPNCGGKAFGGRSCLMIALIICLFPIGLLLLLIKPNYSCSNCSYRFQV